MLGGRKRVQHDHRQNQGGCSACKDVVAVRVNPLHTTLLVGETRELIGEPVNAQGVILIGRTISWKSSDEDVVKVTSVGIVSGLAVGNVTISVTVSDVVGTAFPSSSRHAGRRMIRETWPWWVGGPLIGLVVPAVYLYGAKKWGVSSTLRHMWPATVPAGLEYFRYDWRSRGGWQLMMAAGTVIGALIATVFLASPDSVLPISERTWAALSELGLQDREGMVPSSLFSWSGLATVPVSSSSS